MDISTVGLPKGWSREEVIRKSGLSAGKTDIYYYGPDGKKYRSKPQIARELGPNHDLTAFDFKSGRMINQASIIRKAKSKMKAPYDFTKGFRGDSNLSLPVRQTASIFKQPVTVIRSHPDSKVRHDLKHGPADSQQPRQLFWERSLTGVKITDVTEDTLGCIGLPSKIQGISPDLSTENLLQSIAAALHLSNHPIVGQNQSTAKFAKNPTVHVNTNQPLIQQVVVTEEDVRQQENKVEGARKKLEELLAAIEKTNRENMEKEGRPMSADSAKSNESTGSTLKPASRSRKRKASPSKSPPHLEKEGEKSNNSTLGKEPAEKQSKPDTAAVEVKDEDETKEADSKEPEQEARDDSEPGGNSVPGDDSEPGDNSVPGDNSEPAATAEDSQAEADKKIDPEPGKPSSEKTEAVSSNTPEPGESQESKETTPTKDVSDDQKSVDEAADEAVTTSKPDTEKTEEPEKMETSE